MYILKSYFYFQFNLAFCTCSKLGQDMMRRFELPWLNSQTQQTQQGIEMDWNRFLMIFRLEVSGMQEETSDTNGYQWMGFNGYIFMKWVASRFWLYSCCSWLPVSILQHTYTYICIYTHIMSIHTFAIVCIRLLSFEIVCNIHQLPTPRSKEHRWSQSLATGLRWWTSSCLRTSNTRRQRECREHLYMFVTWISMVCFIIIHGC